MTLEPSKSEPHPPRTCQAARLLGYRDPGFLPMQKAECTKGQRLKQYSNGKEGPHQGTLDMDDSAFLSLRRMGFLKLSSSQEQSAFTSLGYCLLLTCRPYSTSRNKPIREGNTLLYLWEVDIHLVEWLHHHHKCSWKEKPVIQSLVY